MSFIPALEMCKRRQTFLRQILDLSVSFSDSLTDLLQAWSLCCRRDTFYVGLSCLALKWLPGVIWFLGRNCCRKEPRSVKNRIFDVISILLHPFNLSWYQLKRLWYQTNSFDDVISTFQVIRGCCESPVQLVIQAWLITYGTIDVRALQYSTIKFTDWEGNTIFIPYLVPCSIMFSLITIIRSIAQINQSEEFLLELPVFMSSIFCHYGAMVVSLTYLNDFAIVAPSLIFLVNLATRIQRRSQPVILSAIIGTTLPSSTITMESAFKTFVMVSSLVICQLIFNLPYNLTGFKYGQLTIFNNYQANLLICCLIVTSLVGLVGNCLAKCDKWSQSIVAIMNLLLIYLVICNLVLLEQKKGDKFGFIHFKKADNLTISVKAIFSASDVNLRQEEEEGQFFSGTMSSLMENSWSSTFGKKFKILKIEKEEQISKLKEKEFSSIILLKMESVYLPASREVNIQSDAFVLLITQPDWLLLPGEGTEVIFTSTLIEYENREAWKDFKCSGKSNQTCFDGKRSLDGKYIYGSQYKTSELYWLGTLQERKVEAQPFCNDPHVKICGLEHTFAFTLAVGFRKRVFFTEERTKCMETYKNDVRNCDKNNLWTEWLVTRDDTKRRFCFESSCKIEEVAF